MEDRCSFTSAEANNIECPEVACESPAVVKKSCRQGTVVGITINISEIDGDGVATEGEVPGTNFCESFCSTGAAKSKG